ncbi:MAG: primase-like DNA-binding domain-containing protein, partial [Candidatus Babeliales bacterium]|nr:primase-like DNA-binding domain-containing protein [Candidatus Babeliales bacterium]
DALCEGGFSIGNDDLNSDPAWQPTIAKDSVYQDYKKWCENSNEDILPRTQFGEVIKKVIFSTGDKRPGKKSGNESRARYYTLPSRRKAQEEFCKAFKEKPERIFDDYEDEA